MNKLFLIPATIGNSSVSDVLPANFPQHINTLKTFIVEDLRTARRFLRSAGYTQNFDEVTFFELNKHTDSREIESFLNTISKDSIGLLSEAGVPCVADPGATIVALAHRKNIQVVPLVGPSSILLALMASGLNGQNFCFNGYLPIDKKERERKLKELEQQAVQKNQTQIFIETPFRNNHLFESILTVCNPSTKVGIAVNITQSNAIHQTKTVSDWKKQTIDLHKQNCVFLIGKD
ncbi:MAG: SAM-dependent methyltransferase [Bacteroidales bacterium]|nr:SAM-dependent methyltransferase [Bacteroidales bacterium]